MGKYHKLTQEFKDVKFKVKSTGQLVVILAIVAKGGQPHFLTLTANGAQQAYTPINDVEEHFATVHQLHKSVIAKKAT